MKHKHQVQASELSPACPGSAGRVRICRGPGPALGFLSISGFIAFRLPMIENEMERMEHGMETGFRGV